MGKIMRGIARDGLSRTGGGTISGQSNFLARLRGARASALTAALVGSAFASRASAAIGYTSIDYPGAIATTAAGVSGSNIVGRYVDSGGVNHGFIYNGVTYSSIDAPSSSETLAQGIDGTTIVGIFTDVGDAGGHLHGFVYNGATWTTLDHPLAPAGDGNADTSAYGVFGVTTIGSYNPAEAVTHGYTYDGSTYTNLPDHPLGTDDTQYEAIFGSDMAGTFNTGSTPRGFIYDGSSFTTVDHPLAVSETRIHGIYGGNIVGQYVDASTFAKGYFYDGATYMDLEVPGALFTTADGIWGSTVVGNYFADGTVHGYVTTVPEPACLTLACAAGLIAARRRRRCTGGSSSC